MLRFISIGSSATSGSMAWSRPAGAGIGSRWELRTLVVPQVPVVACRAGPGPNAGPSGPNNPQRLINSKPDGSSQRQPSDRGPSGSSSANRKPGSNSGGPARTGSGAGSSGPARQASGGSGQSRQGRPASQPRPGAGAGVGTGAGPKGQRQQPQQRQPARAPPRRSWEEDDEEEEDEDEGELVSMGQDELDKLLFGGKDFSAPDASARSAGPGSGGPAAGAKGRRLNPEEERQAALEACRAALLGDGGKAAPFPKDLAELALEAASAGNAPTDADGLTAALKRVIAAAGGAADGPQVMSALQRVAQALGAGASTADGMAAALKVPRVLALSEADLRARLGELPGLLGVPAERVPGLATAHPELLAAPLQQLKTKLTVLNNTAGLTGEAAVALLTPHMFSGLN